MAPVVEKMFRRTAPLPPRASGSRATSVVVLVGVLAVAGGFAASPLRPQAAGSDRAEVSPSTKGSRVTLTARVPTTAVTAPVSAAAPKVPTPSGPVTLYHPGADLQQVYIAAYLRADSARTLAQQGDREGARTGYQVALNTLLDIAKADPQWETAMVTRRAADYREALARVSSPGVADPGAAAAESRAAAEGTLFRRDKPVEDCYLAAYLKLSEAGQAQKRGDTAAALASYRSTLHTLVDIQKADPDWETALVVHRIADCRSAIASLEAQE
jgi:hypothetical protein